MISNLTVEGVVFSNPQMKVTSDGQEYLQMKLGLFNIRKGGASEFTFMDCTCWSNPLLAKQIMEYDLQIRDRVLVNGKFTIKYDKGKPKLRLYIYDFTLLSRTTERVKNYEEENPNVDYSILENDVEVFDLNPITNSTNEEETENSKEW
jgi:hypothetical protein